MPESLPKLDEIAQALEFLGEWEERYRFLVELGEHLPAMNTHDKSEGNRVQGCMSNVWLVVRPDPSDASVLRVYGDSDNSTVKGLAALLVAAYSGHSAHDILTTDADSIFDALGLYDHLSPTRHVGVYAMVEKIKEAARACAHTPAEHEPARSLRLSD